jgi:hypothetical protein
MAPADGWYSDPTGRHELRYWGGGEWSAAVSDGNALSGDPADVEGLAPPAGPSTDELRADPMAARMPAAAPAPEAAPTPAPVGTSTIAASALPSPAPPPGAPPATAVAPFGSSAPPPPGAPTNGFGALQAPIQPTYAALAPPGAPGSFPVGPGRSGVRLRTGAPGPLAFSAMLHGAPALILLAYGVITFALGLAFDDADTGFSDSDEVLGQAGRGLVLIGLVLLALGAVYAATAIGLSMAAPWARWTAVAIGCVQLLAALYLLAEVQVSPVFVLVISVLPAVAVGLVFAPSSTDALRKRRISVSEVDRPDR